MQKYTKLYAWIWEEFGREDFDLKKLKNRFWIPRNVEKVVHDLTERGCLERVERGKYKAVKPELWMKNIVESTPRAGFEYMTDISRKYAFWAEAALWIWTDGYFALGQDSFRSLDLKIRDEDIEYWKDFLSERNIISVLKERKERRTLFGTVYVLDPEKEEFSFEKKGGIKVMPLEKAVELAKDRRYEKILAELDRKYDIDYEKRTGIRHA